MDRSTSRRTRSSSSSTPRYHGAGYHFTTAPIIPQTSPASTSSTQQWSYDGISSPVVRVAVIPDSDHAPASPSTSSNDSYQYPYTMPYRPTWVPLSTTPVIPEDVPGRTIPQTYGYFAPSGYHPITPPSQKILDEVSKGPYHPRSRSLTDPTPCVLGYVVDGLSRFILRLVFLDIPHVYFNRIFILATTPRG
ncbi:hypothetical protein BD410DRAFT_840584 [Rickenella mellea]|uniref:Uncharacterized protein n=1 Tax=Rickenella mellea TaxID=50990 RepID=A0A4Y7Q228_9AGAM|nr:hypothetical protein BD410DRAFT_840584 [Rickenella mellea]